jgi:rod shape determining protein RodA
MSATTPIQRTDEPKAPGSSLVSLLSFDPLLLLGALGLVAFSFVTLRGAGYASYADRQLVFAGIGLVAVAIITRFDYSILREFRYVFYGLVIVLNIIVFAMPAQGGTDGVGGAHRWIPIPLINFQSSEFGKMLLIVSLASFAVDRSRRMSDRSTVARVLLLALVPAMIVMGQPDLGTGLVYIVAAVAILFFMGISWKPLTALAAVFVVATALVLVAGPALGVNVLHGYQKDRLTTFISPPASCGSNPTCYQLNQSLIAIGSGGKTGRGAAGATQTKFHFLPVANEDFIFAVVGETYGFAGAALVLSLYALLIWRALRILAMSKNLFGTLIAGGILAMFMFQVFLNIGMTIGIMPVTGVPLPLLSYGGSSVIVTFLAIGLLESIHIQARMTSLGKARALIV